MKNTGFTIKHMKIHIWQESNHEKVCCTVSFNMEELGILVNIGAYNI